MFLKHMEIINTKSKIMVTSGRKEQDMFVEDYPGGSNLLVTFYFLIKIMVDR